MVVGVTGGIGSGKSTVVKLFADFENVATYTADKEAKQLMNTSQEIKQKIIAEFSEQAYTNNKLNRSFIAEMVFKDKEKLTVLNSIVHPVVYEHFKHFVAQHKNKDYILYENAILFENGSDLLCDKIITVTAPEKTRIERVVKRDNVTVDDVKNRIKNQWTEEKKKLQSNYVIKNICLHDVRQQIEELHKLLTAQINS